MIKLSDRLATIASLVPLNSRIIDIGCDHALLDIYLYQKKISNYIIASDVNANALNNAKTNIAKEKLADKIKTRLGNGLDTLTEKDNVDTIIISGMGTHTIIGILKNNLNKLSNINTIIVQSNNKLVLLRKEINKLNYLIEEETIVEDNKKYYIVIKFTKGKKRYNKKELYFGPNLLKNNSPLFKKYVKKEYDKLNLYLKLIPKKDIIYRYKIKKEIALYKDLI